MITPMRGKVLVQRKEAATKTPGGILLPDQAKERPQEGKVVALGSPRLLADGTEIAYELKEGDTVLFSSYAGNEIKSMGDGLLIMSEDDILAIVG